MAEVEIYLFLDGFVNFFDEDTGLADKQDFFFAVLAQPVDQPFDLLFES